MTQREEKPVSTAPEQLFSLFNQLDISYELYHHPAFFTVEEGLEFEKDIPGTHCRNLFLRDKKKKMFLITAANETPVDLKALRGVLNCGRLSFGSKDRLREFLGIEPGSVSPFCVINDENQDVQIVLDKKAVSADIINVHPLDNTMTVGIAPNDLLKFFNNTGHAPLIVDFDKMQMI